MEFLMNRSLTALFGLLLAALAAGGCSSSYKISSDHLLKPSPWPYYHGSSASTGERLAGDFAGRLDVVWEHEINGKLSGPMTLLNGFVAVPSSKSRIWLFNVETGRKMGKIKSKGPAQTGLVLSDTLALFAVAPKYSRLVCLNLRQGNQVWQRRIKDCSRGSIVVGDNFLIGSVTGRLTAYRIADGAEGWSFYGEEEDQFTAPAASGHDLVFQPGSKGILYAVSAEDGTERYRVNLQGPMYAGVAVGDLVVATDVLGNVYGIDPSDGTIRWTTGVGGPVWTTPAISNGIAYVGHSGGELVALRIEDGMVLWRFLAREVIVASPVVVGRHVVVGTLGGSLFVLDAIDGEVLSTRELKGGIQYTPITDGNRVFVSTNKGYVMCLGDAQARAIGSAGNDEQPDDGPDGSRGGGHWGSGSLR